MIYFDHAATTPVDPEVVAIITDTLTHNYGNPSSLYQKGREARQIVDEARRIFAGSINAKPIDLIVTSGATESNNTAIIATALAMQEKGRHLITTEVEHHSVLHPMQYLETLGFEVTYLPVDETGRVTATQVKRALREDTILVSIMYVNNEVGSINPIGEIGAVVAEHPAYFHTDAVQAYGTLEIDVVAEQIDMLSTTAHKLNGPKGIGFLYRRNDLHLPNYLHGGTQENDHRAGTENTPYIRGYAKAVEKMVAGRDENNAHKLSLRTHFLTSLKEKKITYSLNGSPESGVPHILNVWFPYLQSDKFLIQCDLKGIMISAGSACTAGSLEPSHVLTAMFGKGQARIGESVRISFGADNTLEEVDEFVAMIAALQEKYKSTTK
ncbi:cysteine desulfurase family protein [Jeotgalibaca sp. A127]|uniref:cysteine desulfurase family protein n=1 Tax=Jeotgalibaca sp. A127 TaxID=3457324 RepID=UPI003FD56878